MKLSFPSALTIVRLVAFVLFLVSGFLLDSRFGILTFLVFAVFLVTSVASMRSSSKRFDIEGLKRLRDVFPKRDD